jgi:hypothetical protein
LDVVEVVDSLVVVLGSVVLVVDDDVVDDGGGLVVVVVVATVVVVVVPPPSSSAELADTTNPVTREARPTATRSRRKRTPPVCRVGSRHPVRPS